MKESDEDGTPEGEFSYVVSILSNMFGQFMDSDVIFSVVESCDGDLQHSIDALMQITKDIEDASKQSDNTSTHSEDSSKQSQRQAMPEPNPFLATLLVPGNNDSMASDTNEVSANNTPTQASTTVPPLPSQPQLTISYANASRGIGVVPKKRNLPKNSPSEQPYKDSDKKWMDQVTRIIERHYKGYRILIIMRGPPGSGKTSLSRKLVDATVGYSDNNYRNHIQSTDDFFLVKGTYVYAKERLSDAHAWNHNRVQKSLRNGLSPVIVDNTNIEIWELEPYVKFGVKEGYYIEVVEPISPWAKSAYVLSKKNTHNVSMYKIKKMLENYEANVLPELLIRDLGLMYPFDKVPPVMRQLPEFIPENCPTISYMNWNRKESVNNTSNLKSRLTVEIASSSARMLICKDLPRKPTIETEINAPPMPQLQAAISSSTDVAESLNTQAVDEPENNSTTTSKLNNSDDIDRLAQVLQKYNEVEKKLNEFDELDAQWEMGEKWDEPDPSKTLYKVGLNPAAVTFHPKSDRFEVQEVQPSTSLMGLQEISNVSTTLGNSTELLKRKPAPLCPGAPNRVDWREVTRFMPDWNTTISSTFRQSPEKFAVEKISSGTSMEMGDTNVFDSKYKVVTGSAKDINFYYMPQEQKIPDKRMLDKSSMTNDQPIVDSYRCKNEEKHFAAFRKMFKNISRVDLRDIFDKCCGDVNWAVGIVIDGVAANAFETIEEEDASDTEDLVQEQCGCLAAYNVIPNVGAGNAVEKNEAFAEQTDPSPLLKKVKKEKAVSETIQQLKKQIEQNVVIADNHYSQQCLKIKKMRRGENEACAVANIPTSSNYDYGLGTLNEPRSNNLPDYQHSDNESESSQEHEEPTVNVNLGREFVIQLDELCNRRGTMYASNIVPHISMPISTLNELNALWIESLTHQIETQNAYSEILLKEDEEFARQLAAKEAEMAQEGREPEIPDFKEIMDMDFAYSVYQKDVAEWRNKEPNDMAARMTREKLYNLFPDVSPDTLSELLMAHSNNFKATVEVLLMSTGQSQILEQKNGLNKFVMEKEMERHEKILEQENKLLSEEQFPVLSKNEKVDMEVVERYRQEAQCHLERRNANYQKAQTYIERGMTQCASYASDVAGFHKRKFEQANSRAATALVQVNAANRCNDHLDLHFLFVTEALMTLDIFLDHHINTLRDDPSRGSCKTLFIITGRGLHSNGGARIKPAVGKRLRLRGLKVGQKNPGLLTTAVRSDSLLTHEWET